MANAKDTGHGHGPQRASLRTFTSINALHDADMHVTATAPVVPITSSSGRSAYQPDTEPLERKRMSLEQDVMTDGVAGRIRAQRPWAETRTAAA